MSKVKSTFCPRCGATTETVGLCDECFVEETPILESPREIELRVCSECGSFMRNGGWTSTAEHLSLHELAMDVVEDSLRAHVEARDVSIDLGVEEVDRDRYSVKCDYSAMMRGYPVEEAFTVDVVVERESCPTCSKLAGGYYESIVQVRARDRVPSEEEVRSAREIAYSVAGRDYGDRETFVSKTLEVDGGLDIYMSTNKSGLEVARRLVGMYGGSISDSSSLVGMEDGEEVYRVTYAVHLPRFVEGDIVVVDGSTVVVEKCDGDVWGVDLGTGDRGRYAGDARKVGEIDNAGTTTIVSVGEGEVQVLDPETYETVTLQRPRYLDADQGDDVDAVTTEEGLYLLPNGVV